VYGDNNYTPHVNDITLHQSLFFTERVSLEGNIINIAKCLGLTDVQISKQNFSFLCDYSLIRNIKSYSIPINTGIGCKMNCSFCSVSNSDQTNKSINALEKELDYLFKQGCKYFFVENHSFCTDYSFINAFASLLINKYSNIDYVWSFWGSVEFLKKYDDSLCELLVATKLVRIEIGMESTSERILQEFGLKHNTNDVKDILCKFHHKGIKSFQINIIIGSQLENKHSKETTEKFITEIYELIPGIIDFQFSYFYLDNHAKIKYQYGNEIESIDYSKGSRKRNCFYSSKTLPKGELIILKTNLVKLAYRRMAASIYKMSVSDRYYQMDLANKGIISQVNMNFLSKGSTGKNHSMKQNNPFLLNSWEIFDDKEKYTSIILSPVTDINGEKILIYDPLLAKEGTNSFIRLKNGQEIIYDLAKTNNYNIKNMIAELIKSKIVKEESEILSFLKMLEQYDFLFYAKVFN
jgi:hypothetical protein